MRQVSFQKMKHIDIIRLELDRHLTNTLTVYLPVVAFGIWAVRTIIQLENNRIKAAIVLQIIVKSRQISSLFES